MKAKTIAREKSKTLAALLLLCGLGWSCRKPPAAPTSSAPTRADTARQMVSGLVGSFYCTRDTVVWSIRPSEVIRPAADTTIQILRVSDSTVSVGRDTLYYLSYHPYLKASFFLHQDLLLI